MAYQLRVLMVRYYINLVYNIYKGAAQLSTDKIHHTETLLD